MKRRAQTDSMLAERFDEAQSKQMCVFCTRSYEKKVLVRRVEAGEIISPLPGLYARPEYWNGLSRTDKALHAIRTENERHNGWVFSHSTAALVHGLEVPYKLYLPLNFATDRDCGSHSPKYFKHHRHSALDLTWHNGIKVTKVARTVVDCAREYDFGSALAIADSALHKELVTKEDLEAMVDYFAGWRGIRSARRVVDLADPRPESGGESIVRALMIDLDLPMPELQAPVPRLDRPGEDYRVDFLFRPEGQTPVAFELDGLAKYQDMAMTCGKSAVQVMAAERQREAAITASGIRVVRMGFGQATSPNYLLRHLAAYGVCPRND